MGYFSLFRCSTSLLIKVQKQLWSGKEFPVLPHLLVGQGSKGFCIHRGITEEECPGNDIKTRWAPTAPTTVLNICA